MEGFSNCQVSLVMQRDNNNINESSKALCLMAGLGITKETNDLVVDQSPMDLSIDGWKSPEELLLLVMLYNLALSYHLFASSSTIGQVDDDVDDKMQEYGVQTKEQIAAILGDALRLYEEACIRLDNLDPALRSALHRIPALENNMRHAKLLHLYD